MRPLILAACVATALTVVTRAQQPALAALLDTYLHGRYDEAVRQAAAIEDLGPLRVRFVQDVPGWVRRDPAAVEQRRAAAAAFLLELTRARLESDWGRLADLIEFECVDLRSGAVTPSFELAWHRASVALAGRARARLWLLGEYAVLSHQKPRQRPPNSKPDPNPKHLMHALERFPDDPQLQLARIVAWTWGRDQEPIRNTRERDEDDRRFFPRAATPQVEAVRALEALAANEAVGAEAVVRIAQMRLAMAQPKAALEAADQAAARGMAPQIRYLAALLAGRALEALDRPDEAARNYRTALEIVPRADSASIALGSLQFVRDDREHAVALFGQAFNPAPSIVDPGRLIGYGSFMHWPELQTALRAELAQ